MCNSVLQKHRDHNYANVNDFSNRPSTVVYNYRTQICPDKIMYRFSKLVENHSVHVVYY